MIRAYINATTKAVTRAVIPISAYMAELISFGFWSKDNDADYYCSLEDEQPYYSIEEKS